MTLSPVRHPDPATLMSHAADSLVPALAAVVACHLAVCRHCQRELQLMETLGLAVLAEAPPVAMARSTPVLAPGSLVAASGGPQPHPASTDGDVPLPLRRLVGDHLDRLRWAPIAPGISRHVIQLQGRETGILQLIEAQPGRPIPEHGHAGAELTYVLRGCFRDQTGTYGTGDLADLDGDVEHTPVADPDLGCICLVASEAPAVMKGLLARLAQPFLGS